MKEASVRKSHRTIGMILVWFLGVQALTGLLLALGTLTSFRGWGGWGIIHYGWDPLGSVYRIILAITTLGQGISGIILFSLMRARMKKG